MSENARFIRWQQVTLKQLGYVSNTTLTLATASIGFSLAQLPDQRARGWTWFAVLLFGLSIFLGLFCAMNRLKDFRETAQIAKGDIRDRELEEARRNRQRGDRTWLLLIWQIVAFFGGALTA